MLPRKSVTAVRATGLPTLRIPARYGGPGGSLRDLFGVILEIAAADPNLAQGLRSHFGFVESLLSRPGPQLEAARARWLAEVLNGKLFGLASAEIGVVDPADFKTTLRDGVLNGRKYYSTGSLFADLVEVIATDGGRLVSLVVPTDRAGVSLVDDFDAMGQRTTASGSTIFDNVPVYPDEIIEVLDWNAPDRPLTYLGGFYQLYLATVAAGIARNAFSDAVAMGSPAQRGPRCPRVRSATQTASGTAKVDVEAEN